MPAGFLHHFAVQRGNRVFALVDTAPGQLKLGDRGGLVGDQHRIAIQQHRINSGPPPVALPRLDRFAIPPDRHAPWTFRCPDYIGAVCQHWQP